MYVVKISRGDLTYCFPVENKIGRLVVSILERLGSKTVLDFTGMLYLRHPFEMGGAYFSFTLLSTPVVCLYICSRYLDYVSDEEGKIFFARSSALPFCAQHFHLYKILCIVTMVSLHSVHLFRYHGLASLDTREALYYY